MKFDEQRLSALKMSGADIARLRRRNIGGTSGGAGYAYQRRYALVRVLELLHDDPDAVVDMEGLCPVDDVIVGGAIHEHSQCKLSRAETWNTSKKKLAKECASQRRLLVGCGVDHVVRVVVPNEEHAADLRDKMPTSLQRRPRHAPASLRSSVEVRCFPEPDVPHQAWTASSTATALDALLPPELRSSNYRESVWRAFSAELDEPWQEARARDVAARVLERNAIVPMSLPMAIRPSSVVTASEWQQVVAVLEAIPGLSVKLSGGIALQRDMSASWRPIARCDTAAFRRFVDDVLAAGSLTMEGFRQVLPR